MSLDQIPLKDRSTLASSISVNIHLAHPGHAQNESIRLSQQNDAKIRIFYVCVTGSTFHDVMLLIIHCLPSPFWERGGSVVECRTPEREVRGSRPTAAVLCPWARDFTPRKYWLITQEAMAPSRHDWKIVDWDVKPQHNQPTFSLLTLVCRLPFKAVMCFTLFVLFGPFFSIVGSWVFKHAQLFSALHLRTKKSPVNLFAAYFSPEKTFCLFLRSSSLRLHLQVIDECWNGFLNCLVSMQRCDNLSKPEIVYMKMAVFLKFSLSFNKECCYCLHVPNDVLVVHSFNSLHVRTTGLWCWRDIRVWCQWETFYNCWALDSIYLVSWYCL